MIKKTKKTDVRFLLIALFAGLLLSLCTGCAGIGSGNRGDDSVQAYPDSHVTDRSICSVDFANFAYPDMEDASNGFTLVKGECPLRTSRWPDKDSRLLNGATLTSVQYAKVGGHDDAIEAIVSLRVVAWSTRDYYQVFIYGMNNKSPTLLGIFKTGYGIDGGLRRAYESGGNLIMECYSDRDATGLVSPKYFTRSCYQWRTNQFVQVFPTQTLPLEPPFSNNPLYHVDLRELLSLFMNDEGNSGTMGSWDADATIDARIEWENECEYDKLNGEPDIKLTPYKRTGKAIVYINDKPSHYAFDYEFENTSLNPNNWNIKMAGSDEAVAIVYLETSGDGYDYPDIIQAWAPHILLSDDDTFKEGTYLSNFYQVKFPNKRPVWIQEEWSKGNGGWMLTIKLIFDSRYYEQFRLKRDNMRSSPIPIETMSGASDTGTESETVSAQF